MGNKITTGEIRGFIVVMVLISALLLGVVLTRPDEPEASGEIDSVIVETTHHVEAKDSLKTERKKGHKKRKKKSTGQKGKAKSTPSQPPRSHRDETF